MKRQIGGILCGAVAALAITGVWAGQKAALAASTVPLQARNGVIQGPSSGFRFVGTPASVPVAANARIVASATLPVAVLTGVPAVRLDYDICVRATNGLVRNTGGDAFFQTVRVTPEYAALAISTTFTLPAAGRYAIGLCVRNRGREIVDHDVLRGFVEVLD